MTGRYGGALSNARSRSSSTLESVRTSISIVSGGRGSVRESDEGRTESLEEGLEGSRVGAMGVSEELLGLGQGLMAKIDDDV